MLKSPSLSKPGVTLKGRVITFKEIDHNLKGEPFRNVSRCPTTEKLKPQNIHVLMMGSEKYLTEYKLQLRSAQEYCKLHGYIFHAQNPNDVYSRFGVIPPDRGRVHVVSSKALFIHCKDV